MPNLNSIVIDSKSVLYSSGKNDECYTPDYGVTPILEFIPPDVTVWCPFDTDDSEFVKQISLTNTVTHSHIGDGRDFFDYEPEHWDIIVSNPPFQGKRQFFERALSFNKPFALLMTATWLNDAAPAQLFATRQMQLLLFDKRMEFIQPNAKQRNKVTFNSIYFCTDLLPRDIITRPLLKSSARLPL